MKINTIILDDKLEYYKKQSQPTYFSDMLIRYKEKLNKLPRIKKSAIRRTKSKIKFYENKVKEEKLKAILLK